MPVLTEYFRLFYDENHKIIPDQIQLTPLALAVWYMDDGARNRKSAYFNTQQFSLDCQKKLLKILLHDFRLNGSLNKDKIYFRIRLFQESAQRLKRIIQPLMPECMHYKLPL